MVKIWKPALVLLLIPFASANASVARDDVDQIMAIYDKVCVDSAAMLEHARPIITQMESAGEIKPIDSTATKTSWAVQTRYGHGLIFAFDNKVGVCLIYIQQADSELLRDVFISYVNGTASILNGKIIKRADNEHKENGRTFYNYEISSAAMPVNMGFALSLTPSEKLGAPQHLLTYNLAKKQ